MNCRLPKVDFIQLPLRVFAARFPDMVALLPPALVQSHDDNYVVRFDGEHLEIGYNSDDWLIGS